MTPRPPNNTRHRYEEIAADLRERIMRGEYSEGDKLPGENTIMKSYGVARATARDALAVLRHEGLATARRGVGIFVQPRTRIVRDTANRYSRTGATSTSPFRSDAEAAGHQGDWEHHSQPLPASPELARRLEIDPGDQVMHTTYRYFADGRPIQLAESWEPLAITGGTPIEYPEDGAAVGVIARMDSINQRIATVVERVTARAATPHEVRQLQLPVRGAYVLAIERTHYTPDAAVETCDIVFPGDRYELMYTIPVRD